LTVSGYGIGEAERWLAQRLAGCSIDTISFRLVDTPLLQFLRVSKTEDVKTVFIKFSAMGVAILTYITPINYQAGEKYVGSEFPKALKSNVNIVSAVIKRSQVRGQINFLDYSTFLPSEFFFHADNATEHLNQEGRRALAGSISRAAIQLYCAADRNASKV